VTHVALESAGYGYHVRIRSYVSGGTEITLAYAHLSTVDVTVGMLVEKGDGIGFAGSTGNCRSPHVHLGMRVKGVRNGSVDDWLNPRPYLDTLT
jgi:murein DD-endopeptidase MepM/ murein hydrolase activator NlpD